MLYLSTGWICTYGENSNRNLKILKGLDRCLFKFRSVFEVIQICRHMYDTDSKRSEVFQILSLTAAARLCPNVFFGISEIDAGFNNNHNGNTFCLWKHSKSYVIIHLSWNCSFIFQLFRQGTVFSSSETNSCGWSMVITLLCFRICFFSGLFHGCNWPLPKMVNVSAPRQ